jgi:hypothetical protein
MLEATTAERLVRLRHLLHAALSAGSDETAPGRHQAVIALDGVCELAMGLAASELDLDPRRDFFALLQSVTTRLGTRWRQDGAKGVRELHRARNNLQHHGVLPDHGHLPVWAAEVERFIASLVAAAFEVELATVSSAAAVESDELRELLTRAECELDGGDYNASMEHSDKAFTDALSSFRSQRGRSGLRFASSAFNLREFSDIKQSLQDLEVFVDVAALASDPGEWLWLRAARSKLGSTASPPTKSDAERALTFALGWVLRYEAFTARYATARVEREERPRASPTETYAKPVPAEIRPEGSIRPERVRLDVELSEVPPEWMHSLFAGLDALRESGRMPADTDVFLAGSEDTVALEVPADTPAADIKTLVRSVIDETHCAFEQRLEELREQAKVHDEISRPYAEAIAEASENRLGRVAAESRAPEEGPRVVVEVTLPDHLDARGVAKAFNIKLETDGRQPSVSLWNRRLSFAPMSIPAEEFASRFREAVATAEERQRQREKDRARRVQERERLASEVRATLLPGRYGSDVGPS